MFRHVVPYNPAQVLKSLSFVLDLQDLGRATEVRNITVPEHVMARVLQHYSETLPHSRFAECEEIARHELRLLADQMLSDAAIAANRLQQFIDQSAFCARLRLHAFDHHLGDPEFAHILLGLTGGPAVRNELFRVLTADPLDLAFGAPVRFSDEGLRIIASFKP